MFEQDGLQAHIDHYRTLFADGRLTMGGPFFGEGAVGMMIPEPASRARRSSEFAAADPSCNPDC